MREDPIIIARRFRGPKDSGNGGYSTGVVGVRIGSTAEVTLRAPPPLERPLDVERAADGSLTMRHGERVIAEGRPAALELDVPEAVSWERAKAAEQRYPWREQHPFPECFVCGNARPYGDGLAIWPGAVEERRIAASTWVPDPTLARSGSTEVPPELVWSALDCPTWHGLYAFSEPELALRSPLLGRLVAKIEALPRVGERCVVIGWELEGGEGRKRFGGAAVFGENGRRLGYAKGTWILSAV
jgi:hypothetical protein